MPFWRRTRHIRGAGAQIRGHDAKRLRDPEHENATNRERALFSHIWNFARDKGHTAKPNPCAGIKGYEEKGRDVYIEQDVYTAIWDAADQPLCDAMDLAYLTGQRPSDVLAL